MVGSNAGASPLAVRSATSSTTRLPEQRQSPEALGKFLQDNKGITTSTHGADLPGRKDMVAGLSATTRAASSTRSTPSPAAGLPGRDQPAAREESVRRCSCSPWRHGHQFREAVRAAGLRDISRSTRCSCVGETSIPALARRRSAVRGALLTPNLDIRRAGATSRIFDGSTASLRTNGRA